MLQCNGHAEYVKTLQPRDGPSSTCHATMTSNCAAWRRGGNLYISWQRLIGCFQLYVADGGRMRHRRLCSTNTIKRAMLLAAASQYVTGWQIVGNLVVVFILNDEVWGYVLLCWHWNDQPSSSSSGRHLSYLCKGTLIMRCVPPTLSYSTSR